MVRQKSRDIDECGYLGVVAGLRDDGATVAVTHQDNWTFQACKSSLGRFDIIAKGRLRLLHNRHGKTVFLQEFRNVRPARSIRESAMNEHNILHGRLLRVDIGGAREGAGDPDASGEYSFDDLHFCILLTDL